MTTDGKYFVAGIVFVVLYVPCAVWLMISPTWIGLALIVATGIPGVLCLRKANRIIEEQIKRW